LDEAVDFIEQLQVYLDLLDSINRWILNHLLGYISTVDETILGLTALTTWEGSTMVSG